MRRASRSSPTGVSSSGLPPAGAQPSRRTTSTSGPWCSPGHRGAAYGPRGTVLDRLLVEAAAEAGAEVREGFTLVDVVIEDGPVTGIHGHDRRCRTLTVPVSWWAPTASTLAMRTPWTRSPECSPAC